MNVCIIPGGGSECRPQREEELCPSEAPSWPPAPQSVVASVPPTNYRDKDRLDRSCNLEAIRLISRSGFGVNIESCGMVAADGRRAFKLDVGVTIRPGSGSVGDVYYIHFSHQINELNYFVHLGALTHRPVQLVKCILVVEAQLSSK